MLLVAHGSMRLKPQTAHRSGARAKALGSHHRCRLLEPGKQSSWGSSSVASNPAGSPAGAGDSPFPFPGAGRVGGCGREPSLVWQILWFRIGQVLRVPIRDVHYFVGKFLLAPGIYTHKIRSSSTLREVAPCSHKALAQFFWLCRWGQLRGPIHPSPCFTELASMEVKWRRPSGKPLYTLPTLCTCAESY